MSAFDDLSFSFEEFAGRVRLFPLPNLVLFPHVMQPLHVFERRYRELLEDALAGDRLIAMAALAPGWERNYEGRPALYPMACLGRITAHHRLADGTYNVLLLGLRRVKLCGSWPRRGVSARRRSNCARTCTRPVRRPAAAPCSESFARPSCRSCRPCPRPGSNWTNCWAMTCRWVFSPTWSAICSTSISECKQSLLAEVNVYRRVQLLLCYLSESVAELARR